MGWSARAEEGTPQGGPLSPLLSNLMLDVLDKELEKRGHRFVRYADDCNIYVRSQRAGERVMASIEQFLAKRLKLKVNRAKSAVAEPRERKFLGFSFTAAGQARGAHRAAERSSGSRQRVRNDPAHPGHEPRADHRGAGAYLVGWRGYFGFCETPSVLRELDSGSGGGCARIVWKQWKRGRTRFAELRRRGVGRDLAAQTAGSPHGPWRLSRSPALALPSPSLLRLARPAYLAPSQAAQSAEPPYTDPYVRWCGRGGAVRLPPIPMPGANWSVSCLPCDEI